MMSARSSSPSLDSRGLDLNALSFTANCVRALAIDAVQKANSGHPGLPLGMAEVATLLWSHYLRFDPGCPDWPDRDRFVLSAGHGSMLLYALLHMSGFDLSLGELQAFRQWGSLTPGHPEHGHTMGVETTTGPLGQGVANAVGMALAERCLAARYNRPGFDVVDHRTFVIAGDGDMMEGVTHEACSLAGHLGLSRLTILYDDNHISIDGPTDLAFSENVLSRFEAYGWLVLRSDGHKPEEVADALDAALQDEARPSIVACRTVIGYGSPNRAGTAKAHGEPLGEEEVRLTKELLGWPPDERFHIPALARAPLKEAASLGRDQHHEWDRLLSRYGETYPELAADFVRATGGELPSGWQNEMPVFSSNDLIATRAASGRVLDALVPAVPDLLGGSADLTGSNNTLPKGGHAVKADDFSGKYVYYGVREHGMSSIMNGLALHGGVIPYGGTFLVFSDYMRPGIRLAAMMGLGVIYVFTHDSIGLGEDGPTHQPVEHLLSLRAIPRMVVIRPADGPETAEAWRVAIARRSGPTALVLTRQKLPVLERGLNRDHTSASGLANGAYILIDSPETEIILLGSGSEVHIALQARLLLEEQGVAARVVSIPSWELFESMSQEYRDKVLPPTMTARVAIEAGVSIGWERYVGRNGIVIGVDRFGASAPYEKVYAELGVTAGAAVDAALGLLGKATV